MKSSSLHNRHNNAPGGKWLKLTLLLTVLLPPFVGITHSSADDAGAHIALSEASAALTQTGDTAWTLAKTGTVNAASNTVTWTISANQGATTAGLLIVNGVMTVHNSGPGGATIGNIVVNLQTKDSKKWITRSSDIADATHGDAATTAYIHAQASSEGFATFNENAASGQLRFTDATTNSAFALVPQVTIPSGATVSLLFSATFDNNVLALPVGTLARAEVIVTFGNSGSSGAASSRNIDINGNGTIDPDEDWVRSVPARLGLTVPAQQPGNAAVTLTDAVEDITTTGTVSFSNPVISLGPTSGAVMVSYDNGAEGGTITNCAHLTGAGQTVSTSGFTFPNVAGVNLTACDTQVIGARTCTPGTPGCGWDDGDMVSYGQDSWGGDPTLNTAAALVLAQFDSRFPSGLEVGLSGSAGFSMIFTSGSALLDYLPASGTPGSLNADLIDPTSTSSGVFGGHVLALQLDVDLSDAGLVSGTSGLAFGDLRICGLTTTPAFNGMTIRQFLAAMNSALGGGPVSYSFDDLMFLTSDITTAFEGGAPSLFAQQHLFNGTCPTTCTPGTPGCGWEDGDVLSHTPLEWGDPAHAAGILLNNQFNFVYGSTGGLLEVGLTGTAGFSMLFTSASAVLAYLPAVGTAGPLNADLVDPVSSASGLFGGEVVALELNIDFSDAGHTLGTSGVRFGDLTLCNFTSTLSGLNGTSVRNFAVIANTALGGGSTPYPITDLDAVTAEINFAFSNGSVSLFAQQHLVNGPCGWEAGDAVTYNQINWGDPVHAAGVLLGAHYNTIYFPTGGTLEVGLPGTSGFSLQFTSAGSVLAHNPSVGTVGPLNADLLDPTSSASGAYGGEVVALKLNVDYSDADVLGPSSLDFGNLLLCGFTAQPALNGMRVRDFLGVNHNALGGGTPLYPIPDLFTIAQELNGAFESGAPSLFAQTHVFNGACPP